MKIAVIGIGHVGTAVAVEFVEAGHTVIGIDIDKRKVDAINSGESPLKGNEPRLADLIKKSFAAKSLSATDDFSIVKTCNVIIIAVETPFDLRRKKPLYFALRSALESISPFIQKDCLIIIESTLAPKTTDTLIKPIIERGSNLKAGVDFHLCHAPERVMPGRLLQNIETLDRIIGGVTPKDANLAKDLYQQITSGHIDISTNLMAEMVKTTENAYRDVEIAFANEIALLAQSLELDVFELRDYVNRVPGRHMLLPGTGVGGHCIPKDSWLLAYGTKGNFQPKLLSVSRDINDSMPHYVIDLCEESLSKANKQITNSQITILGVSFLENSGDIRNSPTLTILEDLEVFKCRINLHDPYVRKIQNFESFEIYTDIYESIKDSDVLILSTKHKEYFDLDLKYVKELMKDRPIIIDGRNVFNRDEIEKLGFSYQGVGKYKKIDNKN